jgi:outer membrane protein assembly factor BamB
MNRLVRSSLFLCLGWSIVTFSAFAADWPRFRGPNGTGISNDKNIPVEITEKNILWKLPIPGIGHGSPIVSKEKIFLQSASEDKRKRFLYCIDTKGKIEWTKEVPGGNTKNHQLNSPASSTAAADGNQIYSLFWNGAELSLFAHDYQGSLTWERKIGKFVSDHGAGLSPMVVGDRVILNNDQGDQKNFGPSQVQAFNSKTGEPVWHADRKGFRASYSTPFLIEHADEGPELIVASTAGLTSYQPSNGKINWSYEWTFDKMPLRTVASPIYHQGIIFAVSGDGGGDRSMIALKPDGKGGATKLWNKTKGTPYVPSIVALGDHLYWVNDKENVAVCVEAKTGEIVWSERLGTGSVSASLVLIDGKIYSITESGTIYVFKASPQFELLSKFDLGEGVMATPAVADGKLYIRTQKHLVCIGK